MCGIIGISSKKEDVFSRILLGLYDLQHRGEQACGIAVSDGVNLFNHSGEGLVTDVFNDQSREEFSQKFRGHLGIGQVLYSTVGKSGDRKQPRTFQPLIGNFHGEPFALGHNGNLIDLEPLREEARRSGYKFNSEVSDTEVIVALISVSKEVDFVGALKEVLPRLKGAFALTILYKDKVIGVRDRHGIRPLCIGYNSTSYVLASESCAFYTLNIHFIREIRPGEVIILGRDGIEHSFLWAKDTRLSFCMFCFVYFARPDSIFCGLPDGVQYGQSVCCYRNNAGTALAKEAPADADICMPVPESGRIYDAAFSAESGIPLREGLFRNRHHTTKTFLASRETDRRSLQRRKIHPLKVVVVGKRVVIIEDSLIRGSVIPETVGMLREAGATEVHVRVCSSPVCHRCFLGIDMATKEELVASRLTPDQINRQIVHADSLAYLSLVEMIKATGIPREKLCLGCFNGEYPVEPPKA